MAVLRAALYRNAGFNISRGAAIFGRLQFIGEGNFPPRLNIGPGTFIGHGVIFGLDEEIVIGSNVCVGPYSVLYTATHRISVGPCRMDPNVSPKRIVVEDGSWIAMNCLVLPGVTVGARSVVSAGSVVTKNLPPNSLAEGNPAAVRKELHD
jgi:maltose O-acetyltransferase